MREQYQNEVHILSEFSCRTVISRTNAAIMLNASLARPVQVTISRSVWRSSEDEMKNLGQGRRSIAERSIQVT